MGAYSLHSAFRRHMLHHSSAMYRHGIFRSSRIIGTLARHRVAPDGRTSRDRNYCQNPSLSQGSEPWATAGFAIRLKQNEQIKPAKQWPCATPDTTGWEYHHHSCRKMETKHPWIRTRTSIQTSKGLYGQNHCQQKKTTDSVYMLSSKTCMENRHSRHQRICRSIPMLHHNMPPSTIL